MYAFVIDTTTIWFQTYGFGGTTDIYYKSQRYLFKHRLDIHMHTYKSSRQSQITAKFRIASRYFRNDRHMKLCRFMHYVQ